MRAGRGSTQGARHVAMLVPPQRGGHRRSGGAAGCTSRRRHLRVRAGLRCRGVGDRGSLRLDGGNQSRQLQVECTRRWGPGMYCAVNCARVDRVGCSHRRPWVPSTCIPHRGTPYQNIMQFHDPLVTVTVAYGAPATPPRRQAERGPCADFQLRSEVLRQGRRRRVGAEPHVRRGPGHPAPAAQERGDWTACRELAGSAGAVRRHGTGQRCSNSTCVVPSRYGVFRV